MEQKDQMNDMFYEYDRQVKRHGRYFPLRDENAYEDNLESDPNAILVRDVKGREVGIRAKQGTDFNLYFYLDTYMTKDAAPQLDVASILANSSCRLDVLDLKHKIMLTKSFDVIDIFDQYASELVIPVSREESATLQKDSYRLRLTIDWGDGDYLLFDEDDGMLMIR